jgi:pimeloyl-ACP methyl ester carboxylesterase
MNRADVATGITIAYEESGPPGGDPLLLLAPMGRDHSLVAPLLPRFSQHFHCIAPDYRGTGESDRPEAGYSIAQFAADAVALLDEIDLETVHVAGASMGAAVAMELAIAEPERVRSLSLYTPWARTDVSLREVFSLLRSLTIYASPLEVERAVSWLVFSPDYLEDNWPAIEEHARATIADPTYPPQHAAVGHIEAGIGHDALDRLDAIDAPTLVVAGELDRLIPCSHAEQVRDAISGSRYRLFRGPGSSHGLTVERQDEFLDVALDFLLDAAAPPSG